MAPLRLIPQVTADGRHIVLVAPPPPGERMRELLRRVRRALRG